MTNDDWIHHQNDVCPGTGKYSNFTYVKHYANARTVLLHLTYRTIRFVTYKQKNRNFTRQLFNGIRLPGKKERAPTTTENELLMLKCTDAGVFLSTSNLQFCIHGTFTIVPFEILGTI